MLGTLADPNTTMYMPPFKLIDELIPREKKVGKSTRGKSYMFLQFLVIIL